MRGHRRLHVLQLEPQLFRFNHEPFDLSPEQLNAQAAGSSLASLIATHRDLFAADLYIERLSSETPPVFVDTNTGERSADPMSRLGPTLSYPLTAYLSASPMFPWTRGYAAMRWNCRRSHPEHHAHRDLRANWRGSLCGSLVAFTIRQGWAFDRTCYELYVSPDRAESVLRRLPELLRR